jgi:hypothetical protein
MLRSVSCILIAAVAALATGCSAPSGPPVKVEERPVPAAQPPSKLAGKAPQVTKATARPTSTLDEGVERVLLFWEIRKNGM